MSAPVFDYVETFELTGRGTVYVGPCPWGDCVRSTTRGRNVIVDGIERTVAGIDAYAKVSEPRLGEMIGLAFDE